jgi:hypothetical protein
MKSPYPTTGGKNMIAMQSVQSNGQKSRLDLRHTLRYLTNQLFNYLAKSNGD